MGSFLEKEIKWDKEVKRLFKLLDLIDSITTEQGIELTENEIIKLKKETRHFRKLFRISLSEE